jgi:hypothetical protein
MGGPGRVLPGPRSLFLPAPPMALGAPTAGSGRKRLRYLWTVRQGTSAVGLVRGKGSVLTILIENHCALIESLVSLRFIRQQALDRLFNARAKFPHALDGVPLVARTDFV